jgi:sterol 14-demethylase
MVDVPHSKRGLGEHPERRPVVVAGASAGIGAEIAKTLAAGGHPVAVAARRIEKCEQVAAAIRAEGGEAIAVVVDVTDSVSVEACAKSAEAALGTIEVVIVNAGGMSPGRSWELSTEVFADDLNTNVLGAQRLVRAFVPGMVERQRGDVVFISSDVVAHPRPLLSSYVAAKFGLEGFARVVQLELEGTGVRASVLRPGPTRSEIANTWDMDIAIEVAEVGAKFGQMRHWVQLSPEAIARTVAHLVDAPRGVLIPLTEVQPEAPLPKWSQSAPSPRRSGVGMTALKPNTPPRVGPTPIADENGELQELRTDPVGLLHRVRAECGDVGTFRLADRDVVLVTGAEANETFFRAPESVLDQAEAYPFMTPIFGKGVVFDASPERRQEMLRNSALRGEQMRGHATTIEREINRMVANWGEEGEIDLLDWFAELTIYTTSSCLIGPKFREELDARFAQLYHDLERGTDALAYVDPYLPIESFARRDQARLGLVALVQDIMNRRSAAGKPERDNRDLLDILMRLSNDDGSASFTADVITGIFISMMFAGHHTSSGTAAWTLIELLRNPTVMAQVVTELDDLYSDGSEVSFQALRAIPFLESALKETLRLHPPLVLLLRVAKEEIELGGYTVAAGSMVGASPAVSNRIAEDFPDPDRFDPSRYLEPRQEDLINRWTWIPFGAGKHRCVGSAFAMMQLKAIFSVILRDYEFEMAQPAQSYRDDVSKMVIQLEQPCRVRYRKRVRE